MRKQPALGDADALGKRTDGQRLEAALAGLRQGNVEDRDARVIAFAHARIIRTIVLFVKGAPANSTLAGETVPVQAFSGRTYSRPPQRVGLRLRRSCAASLSRSAVSHAPTMCS